MPGIPASVSKKKFWKLFEDKGIPLDHLRRGGQSRQLANEVNHTQGRGDNTVHEKDEYEALFDLIDQRVDDDGQLGKLTLKDDAGQLTRAGRQVDRYLNAAEGKGDFFNADMLMVHVTGWDGRHMHPGANKIDAADGAVVKFYETDPSSNLHIPPPGADGVKFATSDFSMRNSGNKTLHAAKSSWKLDLDDGLLNMDKVNIKAMHNDPSQMRESLVWDFFADVGVHASRHTYAKLGINDRYMGLFSVIEQVDKEFLEDHFGKNDEGNLYKAYWEDIGPSDLADRGTHGSDYFEADDIGHRSYRLKTNDKDDKLNTYDDLADFIGVLNGRGLGGGEAKFNTDAYKDAVEDVFDAKGFLRWAAANMLVGGWDNYYATPANYYLYNSGKKGNEDGFVDEPYFHWIPWDYDNSFGVDFFKTEWQYTDIDDWSSATKNYYQQHEEMQKANLPLVENLLKNDDFKQYYLDAMEHMLDTQFNPERFAAKIGGDGDGGLWDRVKQPAYLESDSEHGPAHTGRQFTNHEVFLQGNADKHWQLNRGDTRIEGIVHYVRMRHDSAKAQLAELRGQYPKGASGATFDGEPDKLPKTDR